MMLSSQPRALAVLPVISIPLVVWVVPSTSLDTVVINRISTVIENQTPVIQPLFPVTLLSEHNASDYLLSIGVNFSLFCNRAVPPASEEACLLCSTIGVGRKRYF
jgi:hypothetical protein